MTEYIDLNAVNNCIKLRCTRGCPGECDDCVVADIAMVLDGIRPLRIINCGECIHYEPLKGRGHWGYCRCMKVDVRSYEFCARGKDCDGAAGHYADM